MKVLDHEPALVVQRIIVRWSKKSRGAPGAVTRSRLPEALELDPRLLTGRARLRIHEIRFSEWDDFSPRHEIYVDESLPPSLKLHCVELRSSDRGIAVIYCHQEAVAGSPIRNHTAHPKEIFELQAGDSGQISYNGRFAQDEGTWTYQKTVLNLVFSDQIPPDAMKERARFRYTDMAHLF